MERDVKQGKGRFFKNGHELISTLKLSSFSLKEIVRSSVLTHDNLKGNIISSELHSPEEMASGVQQHASMHSELRDTSQIRPLLIPLDFTLDWERQRVRAASGELGRIEDDEDAFELELEFQKMKEDRQDLSTAKVGRGEGSSKESVEIKSAEEAMSAEAFEVRIKEAIATLPGSDLHTAEHPAEDPREIPNHYRDQNDKLDEVGREIIDFAEHHDPEQIQGNHLKMRGSEREDGNAHSPTQKSEKPLPAGSRDEFIPTQSITSPAKEESSFFEKDAIADYHRRVDQMSVDPEEENRIYEEAKHRGYEDGFSIGEQKAVIQASQSTKEAIQKIQSLALHLTKLKREVLIKSAENFREITQAITESLIRKELAFDPNALVTLFKSAIESSIGEDDFVLHVSGRDYEELHGLPDFDLKAKLKVDASLQAGDFRVESKMSSIDGRLSKTIAELMDRLDLEPSLPAFSKAS